MGSRGSLLALTAIALALAVALALDPGAGTRVAPASTRVLPGLDRDRVARLEWRRAGAPMVALERGDAGWRVVAPVDAPADGAAVTAVLDALELLSYRRRGAADELGQQRFALTVDGVELRVGVAVEAVDRVWVARDGRGYLVDGHAVRALDRTLGELRARDAVAVARDEITGIEIAAGGRLLVLSGRPLRVHVEGASGAARAAPEHVGHILDLLTGLQVAEFSVEAEPPDEPPTLTVNVIGGAPDQEIRVYGRCADSRLWLAETPVGLGCLPDRQVTDLAAYPGTDLVDRRVARAARPARIRIGELALARSGTAWRFEDGTRADARAVEQWLDAVAALVATDVEILAPSGDELRVEIGDQRLLVDAGARRIWREREPVALRVASVALFEVNALDFRDRAVFAQEPTGLRSAARGRASIERGETHDDWGEGTDVAAVRAFRDAIARLRAERYVGGRLAAGAVTIRVSFDPPPGEAEPVEHTLQIDRRCRARADGGPVFEVAPDDCQALRRPWR